MVITLTPELEQALTDTASQQGTTPEHLALASLYEQFIRPNRQTAKVENGAMLFDVLTEYLGVLHSSEFIPGGAQLSTNTSKSFAAGMLKKRENGHL